MWRWMKSVWSRGQMTMTRKSTLPSVHILNILHIFTPCCHSELNQMELQLSDISL